MIYSAEFSGLGLIIALIWYIASTFLNDHKKSKKKVDAKKSISFVDLLLKQLSDTSIKKEINLKEESDNLDVVIEDPMINEMTKQDLSELIPNSNVVTNNKKNISKKVNKNIFENTKKSPALYISNILKNKRELQKAILLKEVLGKPKALKRKN